MATPAPEALPSPRGAHLEMMAAVLAGEGLGRVAQIAARHAGGDVHIEIPKLGLAPPTTPALMRVPIVSGPEEVGAVLLMGPGKAEAGEYLHIAALASLTELAVAEAREDAERALRGSFLEELLATPDMEPEAIERRARLLGCDITDGAVGLCADPGERSAGLALQTIGNEAAGAIAQS